MVVKYFILIFEVSNNNIMENTPIISVIEKSTPFYIIVSNYEYSVEAKKGSFLQKQMILPKELLN